MTTTHNYPKERKERTVAGGGACRTKCSGDRQCVCYANVPHTIHCCNDYRCVCRADLRMSGKGVTRR